MATVSLADFSAVLNLTFAEPSADLVQRQVVLPNLLPVVPSSDAVATWGVKSAARTAGGAYAEGADMADGDYDAHASLQASLAWAQYRKGAKVSGLAESISRLNSSRAVGGSKLDGEVRDAVDALAVDVSADGYGGNVSASPVELAGLASAVASSGAYAGIDPATYTDWKSVANSLASASLSFANLRTYLFTPFYDSCGMSPVFCTCDSATFDKIGALFGDQRRYLDTIQTVDGRTFDLKLRGGFRALEVDGVPFVRDRHATANTIYAFGPECAQYRQVPAYVPSDYAQVVAAVKALTGVTVADADIIAALTAMTQRLQPTVQVVAPTGDAFKAMVKIYAQIVVRYRNRMGKLLLT